MASTVALVVAAGRGERAGEGIPKQYRRLAGKPVLRWAVEALLQSLGEKAAARVVIREHDASRYAEAMDGLALPPPVLGGATRQESARNGLEALISAPPERVLIHDAARPLVSTDLVTRVLRALDEFDAVAPMLPVSDTLRRKQGAGFAIVPRDNLWRAQTPQGFRYQAILEAHRRFAGEALTDDLAVAERAGLAVTAVPGEDMNLKLTTPDDFALAEKMAQAAIFDVRTGTGFDAHRFAPGDHVWLCGVKVPHDFGLEGHSDADAGLHALTDALLGAVAGADIGAYFPSTDERWRNAASHVFLEYAAARVREVGGVIAHADVTLICERPKIGPYREAMRARIAEILSVGIARVSVKATTTDGLGFTGRREGIAAQAVATVKLPS